MGDNAMMTKTLDNIKTLQEKESGLYNSLGVSTTGKPLGVEEQQNVLNEINSLTDLRVNLITELKNQYNLLKTNVAETNNDIKDEMTSIDVIEQQLDEKKSQLNKMKNIETNKLRMSEINNYYAERNRYVSSIYYIIVLTLVALCLVLIAKRFIFFIPSVVFNVVLSGVVIVGLIYIVRKLLDLYSRDKMNFDQYDYSGVDPKIVYPSVYDYDVKQLSGIRDVLVDKEQHLQNNVSSFMNDNDKTNKKDTLYTNNQEPFLNYNTNYIPYDPLGVNNYELNLLQ